MEERIKRLKEAVGQLADIHVRYCNDMDTAMDALSTEVMELEEDLKKVKEQPKEKDNEDLEFVFKNAFKLNELNMAATKALVDMFGLLNETKEDKALERFLREMAKDSKE